MIEKINTSAEEGLSPAIVEALHAYRKRQWEYGIQCGVEDSTGAVCDDEDAFDAGAEYRHLCSVIRSALQVRDGGTRMEWLREVIRCGRADVLPWNAADYLDSREACAEYLRATIEDGTPDEVFAALDVISEARRWYGL